MYHFHGMEKMGNIRICSVLAYIYIYVRSFTKSNIGHARFHRTGMLGRTGSTSLGQSVAVQWGWVGWPERLLQ